LVVSVLCFMAFMMARTGFQANGLPVNAPYPVMQSFGLLSLWMLFTQTIFTVNGVLRDDEHRMRELVLSRPVGRAQLVVTRYLGLVLAGFTAFSLAAGLLMVIPLVMPSPGDPVAPLRVASYLSPLFTLILPTLLFVSAVLALIAGVARTAIATYVGGIVLFALYMVTALLVDSPMFAGAAPATPESLARAAWLDPFGMSAYFDQTRYWTPLERTTQLVQWRGRYLGNRVVWLLITAAVLGLAYRIVPLGHRARAVRTAGPGSSASRWWRALRERTTRVARARHRCCSAVSVRTGATHAPVNTASRAAGPIRMAATARLVAVSCVLLLFAVVTLIEALSSLKAGEYGTRILATSGRLADAAPIGVFGTMVLLFFAADVMWRERILRVDGLVDGTPTSSASLLIAKFAALAAIPVVIAVTGLLVAVGVHLASGGQPIEPTVYLASFWYEVYPLLLLAAAVLLLHLVMPNRWVAMLLSVLLVAFIQQGDAMGAEHPMWRFTAAPRGALLRSRRLRASDPIVCRVHGLVDDRRRTAAEWRVDGVATRNGPGVRAPTGRRMATGVAAPRAHDTRWECGRWLPVASARRCWSRRDVLRRGSPPPTACAGRPTTSARIADSTVSHSPVSRTWTCAWTSSRRSGWRAYAASSRCAIRPHSRSTPYGSRSNVTCRTRASPFPARRSFGRMRGLVCALWRWGGRWRRAIRCTSPLSSRSIAAVCGRSLPTSTWPQTAVI
jgi:ABC-type transport system involved in multi-copper enzyme maturation permease subunit